MVGYILVLVLMSGPSAGEQAVFGNQQTGEPKVFATSHECEAVRKAQMKGIAEVQKKLKDAPKASVSCKKVSVADPVDNNTGPSKKSGI